MVNESPLHTPLRVAVTGGIGSGKSYACRAIEAAGYPVFYCDDEAKRIVRTAPAVRTALTALVGEGLYAPDGTLQKSLLSAYLCRGREAAAQVDAVVHPRVGAAFLAWCGRQSARVVFMECALLFEAGFDGYVDRVVALSVNEGTRLRRVMARDGIGETAARRWMALQWREEEKLRRAHYVLRNNEGDDLPAAVAQLLQGLQQLV